MEKEILSNQWHDCHHPESQWHSQHSILEPQSPTLTNRTNTSLVFTYEPPQSAENINTKITVDEFPEEFPCDDQSLLCTLTDLSPGTEYTVSLIACLNDSLECSEKSDSLTTPTLPNGKFIFDANFRPKLGGILHK